MKKIFLLLALACTATVMNAQDISFIYNNDTLQDGDTITVYGAPSQTIMASMKVKNNTDAAISNAYALCQNLTPDSVIIVESLCFGRCQAGNVSPKFSVAANSVASGLLVVDLKVPASATLGKSEVFMLTAGNNPQYNNMAEIYIKAIVHSAGIDETESMGTLSASPNPADNQVTIQYTLGDNTSAAHLVIYNITGSQVRSIPLSQPSGSVAVNIDDLPAGIYAYGIEANGSRSAMSKLVVK